MMLEAFNRTYLTQREKVQKAAKSLTEAVRSPDASRLNNLRQSTSVTFNKQLQKLTDTPFLKTRDKLSFVLGVFLMIVIEFVILRAPTYFGHLYVALAFPLLTWRFFAYHKIKAHYFMLDFCYFVQLLALTFILFVPQDKSFFKMFFGLANGPLLGAIVLWQNRIVFHDIDKITSLYIHLMPSLLSFCVRWYDPTMWIDAAVEETSIYWTDIGVMMLFYTLWQVLYLIKTELLDRKKLESDPAIITSARYLSSRRPHPVYQAMKAKGIHSGQVALTLFQFCFTFSTLLLVNFMFQYFWAHVFAVLGSLLCAAWFGACYYFEEFAVRYTERLEKKMRAKQEVPKEEPNATSFTPARRSFILFLVYFAFTTACTTGLLHLTIWT
eukprot:TRINITY_DN4656_c0_g1_i1.p1 TRINITY_DN4656_c0_g1~~TRINITY_DN4656_c0_g1_i1.p1  ORF type:complete len:432 (-),score=67.46 TRINITY_DN4656_c0_g1_i1:61-1206(-)